ncbi:hypothetical protein ACFZA9_21930 [Streptomyces olivaceus]|uniref:hypothetical protein n=1 Tax=Streptomyces olivaceus TaxID=47716 RepID=UPI0036ED96E6
MKRYELRADVYKWYLGEQSESGSFESYFDYENPTIIKATGGSVRTWQSIEKMIPTKQGNSAYQNDNWIQLFTPFRPGLREQVGNVRNKEGEVIYKEVDGSPSTFGILGVFPHVDLNGRTIDYQVVCARSQVQQ